MKDIVIVANFISAFNESSNNRFTYLASLLSQSDSVEIISSNFSHLTKSKRNEDVNNKPYKVTLISEIGYKKNITPKRFLSHYLWGKKVISYIKARRKPDIVYCAIPSLTVAAGLADYCKDNGVKFIIDIQDLWPEAFKMVFNPPLIGSLLYYPFTLYSNKAYKNADAICAVSKTYCKRAISVNYKCNKAQTVFLGTKLSTFDENAKNNKIKKNKNELLLAYCGTLGASYDISCVIDALALVKKSKVVPPKFIIMGDGPMKTEFEAYAKRKKVQALFTGRLPYDQMCGWLSSCDITVNPIKNGAAQSIINKHADYAAAGLPVINTQECKEYRCLVEKYKMGINCRNESAEDIANAIIKLVHDNKMRIAMGKNARKCAVDCFDRENTYLKILRLF